MKVKEYLLDNNITAGATPPKQQDQNGLVEYQLQTLLSIAQNWMRASLLLSNYWWFAIRCACEIRNIPPTTHVPNKITTIFELVHGKEVDYRQLFPLFSIAYIKHTRDYE